MKILFLLLHCLLLLNLFPDELPPDSSAYFSPNLDGVRDALARTVSIRDDSMIVKWRFKIYRNKTGGEALKNQESVNSREILHMTPVKFLRRIFEKKAPVAVPKTFSWRGDDNTGALLPDGLYYYQLEAVDESGNSSLTPRLPAVIDTVSPALSAAPEYTVFSPNSDNSRDTVRFNLTAVNFVKNDLCRIEIRDAKSAIRSWSFQSEIPAFIIWDGKNDKGADAPEENYKLVFEVSDWAGNSHKGETASIRLVRIFETIELSISSERFSPNDDGYSDTVSLSARASSGRGLEEYSLDITGKDGKQYRRFSGKTRLPEIIIFNGLDNNGKNIPDDEYNCILNVKYDSGNMPSSKPVNCIIDTKAPELLVKPVYEKLFLAPQDPSSKQKDMKFILSCQSEPEDFYTGVIVDSSGNTVKTYSYGQNIPSEFVWDGKNENNQVIEGGYRFILEGKDTVNNTSRAESPVFILRTGTEDFSIACDQPAISPNNDSVIDTAVFNLKATRPEEIVNQKITIKNESGKEIRILSSGKFSASMIWDGKESSGQTAPDGKYFYSAEILYQSSQNPKIENNFIFIDTQAPICTIAVSDSVFSPNNDGNKETIIINQQKKTGGINEQLDQLTGEILKDGKIIRKLTWKGNIPPSLSWNGKDQNNDDAPEGTYNYRLAARDSAGNKSETISASFVLVRAFEKAALALSAAAFAPGSRENGGITVTPSLSSSDYFSKRLDYAADASGAKFLIKEDNKLAAWEFRGLDNTGKKLPDGVYYIFSKALMQNGNAPESPSQILLIDSAFPQVKIITSPQYFSPDNDGVDDLLSIGLNISDNLGIASWQAFIFRRHDNLPQNLYAYRSNEYIFMKYSGNSATNACFAWDGKSPEGNMVESANDYLLFTEAIDNAGNKSQESAGITVDVLVERLADGRLKIIINSINFRLDSARLEGNYQKTLDRLCYILGKFPEYNIKIIGHTSSEGTLARNRILSRERAEAVYRYLVKSDVHPGRLAFEGKGPDEPFISPENTEEDRRKNRRVEFFLNKIR